MKSFVWVLMFLGLLLATWFLVRDLGTVRQGGTAPTAVVDRAVRGREAAERSGRELEKNLEKKLAE